MTVPNELILQPGALPGVMNPAAVNAITTTLEQLPGKLGAVASRSKAIEDALAGQGTDPDYVKTVEQFGAMSHQEIYDAVHGPGGMEVTGLQTIRGVWQSASTDLATGAQTAWTQTERLFSAGEWSGDSGDAARLASQRLAKTVDAVAQVFAAVEARVDGLACAAEAIRTAVSAPAPVWAGSDPDDPLSQILPGLVNPETATIERQQADQATVATRAAMTQLYTPNYPPAGTGVPAYPTVQPVGEGGASAPGANNSGGSSTDPNGATPGSGQAPDEQTVPQQTAEDPAQTGDGQNANDAATGSTAQDGGSSAAGSDLGSGQATDPGQTTAAGVGPGTSDNPSSPNSAGTGGPRVGGTPPVGSLSGGGLPGIGGALPGPGQPAPVTSAGQPGTGSAAGGRVGGPMMGPMAPGAGQRKNGDGDDEHHSPEYLRRVHPDWVNGVVGISPVIGYDPTLETKTPRPNPNAIPPVSPPVPPAASAPVTDRDHPTAPAPQSMASSDHPTAPRAAQAPEPAADAPAPPPQPTVSPAVADLLASYGWSAGTSTPASENGQSPAGDRPS
ncbi:hypothetical protein [Nocardia farcinica]|uniref:hypothetical protein n=1 Tax=Nocardia farcinica TaxID=37329 RepID=UPI00245670C6|nr:hypothetical protein [Nocardia farcinica]